MIETVKALECPRDSKKWQVPLQQLLCRLTLVDETHRSFEHLEQLTKKSLKLCRPDLMFIPPGWLRTNSKNWKWNLRRCLQGQSLYTFRSFLVHSKENNVLSYSSKEKQYGFVALDCRPISFCVAFPLGVWPPDSYNCALMTNTKWWKTDSYYWMADICLGNWINGWEVTGENLLHTFYIVMTIWQLDLHQNIPRHCNSVSRQSDCQVVRPLLSRSTSWLP